MVGANLVLHRGARHVELEELDRVPCPPSTDTWFPTGHGTVLRKVVETLEGASFSIAKMELALSRDDARFFGTLTLKNKVTDETALVVGVRNSNDKSFPLGFVAGQSCFVCDNLSFNSEIVISRRHTRFGDVRYAEATALAISNLHQYQLSAAQRIESLKAWELTSQEAESLLLRSFESGIVSSRLLPDVIKEWRQPRHPEFHARNAWSLSNAFTEVFKERQKSNPQEAAYQTIRLGRLIAPPSEGVSLGYETTATPA